MNYLKLFCFQYFFKFFVFFCSLKIYPVGNPILLAHIWILHNILGRIEPILFSFKIFVFFLCLKFYPICISIKLIHIWILHKILGRIAPILYSFKNFYLKSKYPNRDLSWHFWILMTKIQYSSSKSWYKYKWYEYYSCRWPNKSQTSTSIYTYQRLRNPSRASQALMYLVKEKLAIFTYRVFQGKP